MKELENYQKIFADRLKDLMQENNLNISALEKATKIPHTSISNWLLCKRTIQIDALITIAEYFKVTTDYLLGREF